MKLSTVNVIEYSNDSVLGIRSFTDDEDGNKEAEDCAIAILKEQDVTLEEDIKLFLEEGYYEQGDYQLFLTHSS